MQSPLIGPLAEDLDRLAALAGGRAEVPTCPGWTQRELAAHVGGVARMAAGAVRGGVDGRVPRRVRPPDGFEPTAWVRGGAHDLLGALRESDADTPVPMFTGAATPAWWCRRQAVEMAVHRLDAELAAATPSPIHPVVAAAGVEEWFDWVCRRPAAVVEGPLTFGVTTTAGDAWTAVWDGDGYRWTASEQDASLRMCGSASDVLSVLWHRPTAAPVEVVGDAEELARLLAATAV